VSAVQDRRKGAIQTRHRPSVPGAPFVPELEKAAAGGVATLGETNALVPDTQLATNASAAGKALMGDRTWGDVATQVEIDAETAARIADVDAEEAARSRPSRKQPRARTRIRPKRPVVSPATRSRSRRPAISPTSPTPARRARTSASARSP
jgi:hypothetical protein